MIIVLDKSKQRLELISQELEQLFPSYKSLCFQNPEAIISWLSDNLNELEKINAKKSIAVLDNSKKRIDLMRRQLEFVFPEWESVFFDNAPEMIAWLSDNLDKCDLISLDYNLGHSWTRSGKIFDPGTGRDVVNYLATQPPQCPIIFHTSHSEAEIGMEVGLIETNWIFERVAHNNDLQWIPSFWIDLIRLMLKPISNPNLREEDLPLPNDSWEKISKFALTFNGYEYWGAETLNVKKT